MKTRLFLTMFIVSLLSACCNCKSTTGDIGMKNGKDTVVKVVEALPEGEFTYNLPCKVMNIHPEKDGKALLFLWLHGGVHDQKIHSFFKHPNHFDYSAADDSIIAYLKKHDMKSIVLMPICHKADVTGCVAWKDCYADVLQMIDDYVNKGLVDSSRIYIAGGSDGGRGTWDFVADHPERFAAAISLSCAEPRKSTVPVYFFNTGAEQDCQSEVDRIKSEGGKILIYKHCPELGHGKDEVKCTEKLLKEFFDHKK